MPLTLSNVCHTFGGMTVLENISFSLAEQEFVALVGPSGIGKTTLVRIMAGLLGPNRGRVTINGRSPADTPKPLGLVTQRDTLMPWRTAFDNVALPLELQKLPSEEIEARVSHLLQLVGLAEDRERYPTQLSGGMAQRIALARALVHEPTLLLLDEPFGALGAMTREKMGQELLRIWQALPVSVFIVTHSIEEAVFLADRVLVMNAWPGQAATLTHDFKIPLPRPRAFDVRVTPEFLAYTQEIRRALG